MRKNAFIDTCLIYLYYNIHCQYIRYIVACVPTCSWLSFSKIIFFIFPWIVFKLLQLHARIRTIPPPFFGGGVIRVRMLLARGIKTYFCKYTTNFFLNFKHFQREEGPYFKIRAWAYIINKMAVVYVYEIQCHNYNVVNSMSYFRPSIHVTNK